MKDNNDAHEAVVSGVLEAAGIIVWYLFIGAMLSYAVGWLTG